MQEQGLAKVDGAAVGVEKGAVLGGIGTCDRLTHG
jgi:hypothetical protein